MEMHNFSSGPSILPPEVLQKASEAVLNFNNSGLSLIEISHRDPSFVEIMNSARNLALELLNLENKGYSALFLQGGASLEFVRVANNLLKVDGKAGYINTGNWANNAQNEAAYFGAVVEIASSKDKNYSYIPKNIVVPNNLDYLHITTNNTIYGTQFKDFPETDVPLVCDMSSDIFSRNLDFSKFDLIYACAQKNAGTSGINLIVVKDELLNKTRSIPNIMNYKKHIERESMYNTPSVFSVYVSYLTLKWLKDLGGIAAVDRRNLAKANLMYSEIDRNSLFYGTAAVEDRSTMNVTFFLKDEKLTTTFDELCLSEGIYGVKGHRTAGGYRASMYNALPMTSVQKLVEVMQRFETRFL
ncbi:3-phosphoserine/phosphohydroxythreonine transaminase [Paenimyroides viscosum]|uniref:Phosphoserine aminotransferase n=1 Tax=Paenimyroides viscosum TaxID=2488729 RepID=A0A3P1B7R0_9FLAO|nr:3-phosphoserine/phosphohydroxythreonine transaminase [Paenimyroides viscosum]RRA97088.1 3-phosphoserine/phosphohydroxythreonine transaminase [Paenimyroides viscosum]